MDKALKELEKVIEKTGVIELDGKYTFYSTPKLMAEAITQAGYVRLSSVRLNEAKVLKFPVAEETAYNESSHYGPGSLTIEDMEHLASALASISSVLLAVRE